MQKNQALYKRASSCMPWGTQTNAKRLQPGLADVMPAFIERAAGCRLWDVDGREFIDYRSALGPIILGYCHPQVDAAVREQMKKGVLFSMASPIELQAAEAIMENVPWLEQIRFMKTGADACTSCVRLARAYTGREDILTCGYHGYHDIFALNWPNPGVPNAIRETVHEVAFNDLEAVDRIFNDHGETLAAAIVVPDDWGVERGGAFLKRLRQHCDKAGTLLVFDEVLTGFRLGLAGAQEYYGVTPDLAAYAKAMANGYPVSAFAGKREFMSVLEETIITTTYAGETLSLAACCATMKIMREEGVQQHIFAMGRRLRDGFDEILRESGLPIQAAGTAPVPYLHFCSGDKQQDQILKDRLFSSLFERGVFPNDVWLINHAHQNADIDQTLDMFRKSVASLVLQR